MTMEEGEGPTSAAGGGVLTLRSIFVGTAPMDDSESQVGPTTSRAVGPQDVKSRNTVERVDEHGGSCGSGPGENVNYYDDDDEPEPVQLPQSTHSLLFTQPILSFPFFFALVVMALSFACLFLALLNGLAEGSIPVAVMASVTAVQFLTILVVLIMEEEIPTGLWLLRMIPKQSLHQKFPQMKYRKFIFSSVLRILNGYCFLVNVTFTIIRATGVLEIFYDVLALQFVQQLDDMAFILAQKDVLGKAMKRACTAKCFRAEFHRVRTGKTRRARSMSIILKTIYFVNLGVMLGLMGIVSYRQRRGDFQHESITVDFGDIMWERAVVEIPNWLPIYIEASPPGEYEEWILLYAFFNGVYEIDRNEPLIDGRPVYKEMRKIDTSHVSAEVDWNHFESVVPAEIKYCSDIGAWVFTHKNIRKSKSSKKSDQGCNWLLRSPPTDEFDLLNVGGNWQVWVGVIGKADVSIVTNKCSEDSDCNLNGACTDGKCVCESGDESGSIYFGSHCEVELRDECRTILGEGYNEIYRADYWRDFLKDYTDNALVQSYNRPTYTYVEGNPEVDNWLLWLKDIIKQERNVTFELHLFFQYAGNRWFGTFVPTVASYEDVYNMDPVLNFSEYHAFWDKANYNAFISDPTTKSTPVGVDMFQTGIWTGEIGEQFGPFGALYPIQLHNQTGRGYFRCGDSESNLGNVATLDRKLHFQKVLSYNRKPRL